MKISFYTGPTIVHAIAEKFREAGLTVACEGTQHVYVEVAGAADPVFGPSAAARDNVLATLHAKHGTTFGLK